MNPLPFALDPRLAADTAPIAELPLSSARLMRDAQYPWVILIPRQAAVSDALAAETGCLKLNVAAIGNIVRQLHIHVVARNEGDAAWPGQVWGKYPAVPYASEAEADLVKRLASRLGR